MLTFRLILPFNKLAVSLIKPCKTVESPLNLVVIAFESINILSFNFVVKSVESDLNFDVMAVESPLSLVVIAFESINILAFNLVVKSVESDLSLAVISVESDLNFAKVASVSLPILAVKSEYAEPAEVPNAFILFDKLTVSRANLLLNMAEVSRF